jgi:hypothetical protein
MKKTFIAIAVASIFAACNSTPKTSTEVTTKTTPDTSGLAQFQAWKQQEALKEQLGLIEANGINDRFSNGSNFQASDVQESGNLGGQQVATTSRPTVVYRDRTVYKNTPGRSTRSSRVGRSSSGGNGTYSQPTATTARKKGWSKAAKGAVIGGGSGAVLGAIVSKNKVKGAIIGGVIGAGGGYVLGRSKDKKDGRYYLPAGYN